MEITILQMKKSLLLLNKLHKQKFKSYLVKTPSKLNDTELKQFFTLLFIKKDNHYIPKKTLNKLDINEDDFKKLFKQPKEPKPLKPPKKQVAKKEELKKEELKKEEPKKHVAKKEEPKKEEPKKE